MYEWNLRTIFWGSDDKSTWLTVSRTRVWIGLAYMRWLTWVQRSVNTWVAIFSSSNWSQFRLCYRKWLRSVMSLASHDSVHKLSNPLLSNPSVHGRRDCSSKLFTYVNIWVRSWAHSYQHHTGLFLCPELIQNGPLTCEPSLLNCSHFIITWFHHLFTTVGGP